MQMMFAHVVIYAVDSTLQGCEITFDAVCADARAALIADVLLSLMIHLIVPATSASALQNSRRIGHHVRRFINHLIDDRPQILSGDTFHMTGLNPAFALKNRNDSGL